MIRSSFLNIQVPWNQYLLENYIPMYFICISQHQQQKDPPALEMNRIDPWPTTLHACSLEWDLLQIHWLIQDPVVPADHSPGRGWPEFFSNPLDRQSIWRLPLAPEKPALLGLQLTSAQQTLFTPRMHMIFGCNITRIIQLERRNVEWINFIQQDNYFNDKRLGDCSAPIENRGAKGLLKGGC